MRFNRVILPGAVAATLMLMFQGALAAENAYLGPDPKVIAQVESSVGSFAVAPSAKKRRVLVYGISFGPHRFSIRTAQQVFKLLGEKTGAFEAIVSDDLANFEADELRRFDAVVFANTTGEVFCRPADKDQFNALTVDEKRLQEQNAARLAANLEHYVRNGGGFMAIHSATDSLKSHPTYGEMIGAVFAQHPWGPNETVTIKVEDPAHPLAQGVFAQPEFKFRDEIYEFREPCDRRRLHVILSLDLEKSDKPNRPLRRNDGDYPIAWTRRHGQGRVFYCSLGHALSTFADPTILQFWLKGIQFAAGDVNAATNGSEGITGSRGSHN